MLGDGDVDANVTAVSRADVDAATAMSGECRDDVEAQFKYGVNA